MCFDSRESRIGVGRGAFGMEEVNGGVNRRFEYVISNGPTFDRLSYMYSICYCVYYSIMFLVDDVLNDDFSLGYYHPRVL